MEERITGQKQMAREIHIKGLSLYIENHDIITEDFQDIEEAIREAAFQAKGIPSRADILNEYTDLGRGGADGITMEAFIDKLARMGFSWLHAPHGKRGKSQKKSGLKEG
jgi:hypothetical protein